MSDSCVCDQAVVTPVRKYNWIVEVLWFLLFFPGLMVYYLTRRAEYCPECGGKVSPQKSTALSISEESVERAARERIIQRREKRWQAEQKQKRDKTAMRFVSIFGLGGLVLIASFVGICAVILAGSDESGRLSQECRNAIYADVRLSNAHDVRRFYLGTNLEDWNQPQLAAAIDEGGYLESVYPCRTEVRAEFDRRGYKW